MRVAVIGAGATGLPAIKCCLEEGLDVVCFEQRPYIGGLWHYEEQVRDGWSSVMRSTVTNVNKEIMSYSDFPVPADFPVYLPHFRFDEYCRMYADHFKLNKHIRFEVEVVKVQPVNDFANCGRWEVTAKQTKTGEVSSELFDAVMICSGHDRYKTRPHVEGEADFQGVIMHTHDYRHNSEFNGKKIVVIGSGNSACDVAADVADVCTQVYMSSRRGAWMLNRIWDNGRPWELNFFTRVKFAASHTLPRFLAQRHVRSALNTHLDHALYGLQPGYDFGAQFPSVNDYMGSKLANGLVQVRPAVRRLARNRVEFVDGSVVEGVDVIIFATGYKMEFPFIDHDGFKMKNGNEPNLFNLVFPPSIHPPTAAVIGLIDTTGSISAAGEMQCRYAVRVFKGLIKLPDEKKMQLLIDDDKNHSRRVYTESNRQFVLREFIPYMDRLADAIGCTPPGFSRLLLTDPALAKAVYVDLHTALQYRLVGPGAWSGARDAVLGINDRLSIPLTKGRTVDPVSSNGSSEKSGNGGSLLVAASLAAVLATSATVFAGWYLEVNVGG